MNGQQNTYINLANKVYHTDNYDNKKALAQAILNMCESFI